MVIQDAAAKVRTTRDGKIEGKQHVIVQGAATSSESHVSVLAELDRVVVALAHGVETREQWPASAIQGRTAAK